MNNSMIVVLIMLLLMQWVLSWTIYLIHMGLFRKLFRTTPVPWRKFDGIKTLMFMPILGTVIGLVMIMVLLYHIHIVNTIPEHMKESYRLEQYKALFGK